MKTGSRWCIFAFVIMLLACFSGSARACTCTFSFAGSQPCQVYWGAGAVFTGLVTNVSTIPLDLGDGRSGYQQRLVRFDLDEAFHGVKGRTAEVITGMGGGDCGYDFKEGERYFVYAYKDPKDNTLHVGICGRTRTLAMATADLEYARRVAKGNSDAILYGIVLRYTRDSYLAYGERKGMEGISVIAESKDKRFNLVTDGEGRFQLDGVPAGTYRVRAELPEGMSKAAEQPVVIAPGRCAAAEFLTTSLGSIKGKLFDSGGEPAPQIALTLLPAKTDGKEEQWRGREISARTDQEGLYSFTQIPSGQYVIAVNFEGQPGTHDPPYPRSYYPGVKSLAGAKIIDITEGQELEVESFNLPPRLKERTIEGVVEWPDGRPAVGANITLEYTERQWMETNGSADHEGRFSIKGFEGFRYLVHADYDDNGKPMHAEPVELFVTNDNLPLRLIITRPGRSTYFRSRQNRRAP
ncbi:MAG TPA: carboxypeptidase-like regulatory domain-containing protein [Pyrinomonadaceae bacterium]|jgi:hypothetical protein|nr:carboxypeptidase-like regulatory domain-containing protein [Pyrinomonadaceae bacterium]